LHPYTIIEKNDSNESDENLKAKKARIKALYDGENLSLLIEWKDETINIEEGCCSKSRADGIALQFPVDYSDVEKLPYINMGNKDRAVLVHLKNAQEQKSEVYFKSMQDYFHRYQKSEQEPKKTDSGRVFISKSYLEVDELKDESSLVNMDMIYKDGVWKATLSRPLKTQYLDLVNGTFPISVVTWDGDVSNVEQTEYISSWIGVKLFGKSGGDELLDALNARTEGDIYNGKELAMQNCAACHNFADSLSAPKNMAPNLSNVGGYSTSGYLVESIVNPSAIITPGFNPNEQSNFPWYNQDESGNLISTMPSYDWLDEKSLEDLVAYLKTLKTEIE
jgi:complex iron-sulfur molybdoenzyme family reductase subunit gamma